MHHQVEITKTTICNRLLGCYLLYLNNPLQFFIAGAKIAGVLMDKTMAGKLMYIPNNDTQKNTSSVTFSD